ncbi:metal-dependent hydrolase [Rubrivirga sp. S365]|uniref:metal-dependent hydrolase n=1 Tax=Rubrivirga sp. S365 TaxID=3076080 RepID=UPI0028C585F6|nr:metal-dependent hydrolase [Rubrivirga sp. S365]MDT7856473.1 metal-dependent hydrolase [Rubrivirga sp. S365]
MPTIFTHAVAALALGPSVQRAVRPLRLWALGAACAVVPDLDVLAFRLGIPYEHPLGHRGFSHSLVFAAILAAVVVAVFFRRSAHRAALGAYFFAATASHGLLDMLTDGGHGVALLAPFSNDRLFFLWRPIEVSPIGIDGFVSARGLEVLASEVLWVWGPALAVAAFLLAVRRRAPETV